MSRSKLFNMIKSRGEQPLGRNQFDLTNRHIYTAKVAKIMPVKALHTMPDDYFHVSMSEFSQNRIPMNTAAFVSGKKEILSYFVPYNSIWHNFNQFQATREDPDSAALKVKGISYEPRFSLSMLYHAGIYFAIGAWAYESFSKVMALQLWYDTFRNSATSSAWTDYVNAYGADSRFSDLVEFMKANHYSAGNISDWDFFCKKASFSIASLPFTGVNPDLYLPFVEPFDCYEHNVLNQDNLSYGDTILDMFGTPIWTDWCMKLDMLRYGNIYPLLHNWRVKMDAWVDDCLNDKLDNYNGINATNIYFDADRLILLSDVLEALSSSDYDDYYPTYIDDLRLKVDAYTKRSNQGDATDDEYVNVYALYAYNKCFYDYMRNVYFDTNYDVRNYNCDFVDCTDWESSIIHFGDIPCRFYHLESHQWKKDFFTGVLPANQLGQVSQVTLNVYGGLIDNIKSDGPNYLVPSPTNSSTFAVDDDQIEDFSIKTDYITPGGYLETTNGELLQIRTPHTHNVDIDADINASGRFNVLELKRAEALQQYAQDLMRAGNRTQDIFQQIYGVTPKSQMDETPYFIDVASSDLDINPIIATANTGTSLNGKLGDIAARVTIKPNPLEFKFSTKDFGVVLFLSYIIPDSFYNSYNLDPCVTHLDPESHGLPYFQNLGLQPIIGEFLNNLKDKDVRMRVCGYAPPYLERKTDIDLAHGNLVDTFLPAVAESDTLDDYQGENSHWVVARTDMQQEDTVSLRNFYIDPRIVDNVFQFNADSDLSTDHFLTYCTIKVDSVRALSEIGLPRF